MLNLATTLILAVLFGAILCEAVEFSSTLGSSTNTYAEAIEYAKAHPTCEGESWSGWCARLMWMAGRLPESADCPSAKVAYERSNVVSMDSYSAPPGAFHYWDIGEYGHVAMAMPNGWAMMASCHIIESWGSCIGTTPVDTYTSQTGARYLGWAFDYAGAEIQDVHNNKPPAPTPSGVPLSQTSSTGVPDNAYYKRQQMWASRFGYQGPVDGVLGENSWAGTQRGLRQYGYDGPDDGVPGINTYMAMQRLAAQHGYSGPVDGELGPNSYRGLATFFNEL